MVWYSVKYYIEHEGWSKIRGDEQKGWLLIYMLTGLRLPGSASAEHQLAHTQTMQRSVLCLNLCVLLGICLYVNISLFMFF